MQAAFGLLAVAYSKQSHPWAAVQAAIACRRCEQQPLTQVVSRKWTARGLLPSDTHGPCWKAAMVSCHLKRFQDLFSQAYLFGAEATGKVWITALYVENFTLIVVF